jgi:hypothetical protein
MHKPQDGMTTSTRVALRGPRGASPTLDLPFFKILGAGLLSASSLVPVEFVDCAY